MTFREQIEKIKNDVAEVVTAKNTLREMWPSGKSKSFNEVWKLVLDALKIEPVADEFDEFMSFDHNKFITVKNWIYENIAKCHTIAEKRKLKAESV